MIVVGFDPASSRNLGWSLVSFDPFDLELGLQGDDITQCRAGTFQLPSVDEHWRVLWPVFVTIDTFLQQEKPDIVLVEKTSAFAGGFITSQVGQCMGALLAACGKNKIGVSFLYPTHVKKVITGKGKATKTQMKKAVLQILDNLNLSMKFDSEHSCDATANILCWLKDQNFLKEPKNEAS